MKALARCSFSWVLAPLMVLVILTGCDRSDTTTVPSPVAKVDAPSPVENTAPNTSTSEKEETAAVPASPPPPAPSTTESVITRQDIRAQLMPRRYTTLAAEIGARINSLPLPEGAAFVAGQKLVGFDCSLQQAQLQKSQAELMGAEKTQAAHVALEKLNAVGQLELDMANVALERARADIKLGQALLGKCEIRAPFSGRIAEQKVREQQFAQAGQALLDIIDDGALELEFIIPSHWLAWVRPGVRFEVAIDETGKTYPARFTRIGARVDPVSQTVKTSAAIDGRFPALVAGMSGRVLLSPPVQR
jgi:membrane fusion protein, multidrug efflux system